MATSLESAVTPSDGDAIVTVRGDIDADTAPQLSTHLGYLIGQCHYHIVLDLAGMVLIDAAGVDAIVRAAAWTRQQDGSFVVRSASQRPPSCWTSPASPKPAPPGPSAGG